MVNVTVSQGAFNSGELAPSLDSRSNIDAYLRGCRVCTNFLTTPQGPLKKRSGWKFSRPAKFSGKKGRLIDFIFNENDSHILEFGDNYIRFYQNKAPILETGFVITGITQANPAVVTTSAAHGMPMETL